MHALAAAFGLIEEKSDPSCVAQAPRDIEAQAATAATDALRERSERIGPGFKSGAVIRNRQRAVNISDQQLAGPDMLEAIADQVVEHELQ